MVSSSTSASLWSSAGSSSNSSGFSWYAVRNARRVFSCARLSRRSNDSVSSSPDGLSDIVRFKLIDDSEKGNIYGGSFLSQLADVHELEPCVWKHFECLIDWGIVILNTVCAEKKITTVVLFLSCLAFLGRGLPSCWVVGRTGILHHGSAF